MPPHADRILHSLNNVEHAWGRKVAISATCIKPADGGDSQANPWHREPRGAGTSCARSRVFPFEKRANRPRFCAATAQQKKLAGAARGLGASCRRAALGCSSSCGLALRRNHSTLHFAAAARLRTEAFRAASRIDLPKILDACFPRVSSKLRLERGASFLRMTRFRDTGHAGRQSQITLSPPSSKNFPQRS